MTDDVSKLPPMPTDAQIMEFGAQWGDNRRIVYYRARMEALVEYAEHTDSWTYGCASLGATTKAWTEGKRGCTCGLDALLAACERGES